MSAESWIANLHFGAILSDLHVIEGGVVRDDPPTFLDAEAQLGGAFLHPGGHVATDRLLDFLEPRPGSRILELGCGPGTTTVRVAEYPDISIVAIDRSPSMLRVARKRIDGMGLRDRVSFIHGDLQEPLPLEDASVDAVFAESVVAILEPEPILREAARVLRNGGRLALNERIWRPAVPEHQAARVNALSTKVFGIPAATPAPLDRSGWVELLEGVGLEVVGVVPVAELPPPADQPSPLTVRLRRYRHYLFRPRLVWRQLQFKRALQQHRSEFDCLESYLFFARKPVQ